MEIQISDSLSNRCWLSPCVYLSDFPQIFHDIIIDELVITIWDVAIPVTACENLIRDIQKTDVKSKEQFFVAGLWKVSKDIAPG